MKEMRKSKIVVLLIDKFKGDYQTNIRANLSKPFRAGKMGILRGDILEGSFWSEKVKVLNAETRGANIKIEGVGLKTNRFYSQIIPREFSYQDYIYKFLYPQVNL